MVLQLMLCQKVCLVGTFSRGCMNRRPSKHGCVAGRQTMPSAANEQGKVPHLLLPSSRSSGHELMHDASDEMQRRIKVLF